MSAMSITTKVALAGITGKLGRLMTKYFLAKDYVEVHGIARNPDKLPDELKSNPRLKLFKSDMRDSASLQEAVKGCSIVCCVVLGDPSTELAVQKALIDACLAENVPRFMPSEFTLDWRCVDLELLPQKKVNQEIYEYLDKHEDKIKSVHILIGGFMETLFSAGFWFDPRKSPVDGLTAWGNGEDIWELTSYDNAAQWAVAAALNSEATGFLRFLGDRLSILEIAQTLQEVYNTSPIPFTSKGTMSELKAKVIHGLKENPESAKFWDWKGQSYSLFLTNGQAYLEPPLDNNNGYIDSVQQETLEIWLQDKKLEELSKSAWF